MKVVVVYAMEVLHLTQQVVPVHLRLLGCLADKQQLQLQIYVRVYTLQLLQMRMDAIPLSL